MTVCLRAYFDTILAFYPFFGLPIVPSRFRAPRTPWRDLAGTLNKSG
ncbi:MAG: hypothetical protein WCE62_10460 [Polyangiales bacterium]